MGKRIVVTGATGYIAKNIIDIALEDGYDVICLVNPNSSRKQAVTNSDSVRIIECGMDSYKTLQLDDAVGKCNIFFHLAWSNTAGAGRDDAYSQIQNIEYTIDALHLAKRLGCQIFVGAGSQAEFGVVEDGVRLSANTQCNPTSGYGIAKLAAGQLCAMTAKQLGLKFNWIRILSIYGVGDGQNSLISYIITQFKNDTKPSLTKCEQIWDYLNVRDAAVAFWAVADRGADSKTYVLGSGIGKPLSNYIEQIYALCRSDCEIGFGDREYYPHQPMYLVADISELVNDTGWIPSISFKEGVIQIISTNK